MARKKRTSLPAVSEDDLLKRPELVRPTVRGWAWKCAYCGQFASSETVAGRYVCRSHGGVTPRQRDPEARSEALRHGESAPQPPGRPLQTGSYSRRPTVRVDELVQEYRARRIDIDCTDEDMLYLRAYLNELMQDWPAVQRLSEPLERLHGRLSAAGNAPDIAGTARCAREVRLLLKQVLGFTKQLERRHVKIIQMSKVRADTRIKNHAASQLDVFTIMLDRFMVILREQLSSADFEALQVRVERELAELPVGLVDGSSVRG